MIIWHGCFSENNLNENKIKVHHLDITLKYSAFSHNMLNSYVLCLDDVPFFVFGNRIFYFQINRDRKIENKKIGRKKRFPQFLLCMYVCVIWHRYLYVNISKWYLLLFWIFACFRSYPPFSFFTIFFIWRLRVNLSWKSIHQIEV